MENQQSWYILKGMSREESNYYMITMKPKICIQQMILFELLTLCKYNKYYMIFWIECLT